MLALLAISMAPIMSFPDLPVGPWPELPRAKHSVVMPGVDQEDALVIAVTRDGKVYCGADPVSLEQLPIVIRDRLTSGAERKVYLKVDRYARYGVVIGVLAEVRSAGVEKVAFMVEQRPAA
jgi:biopolymer transport protein ExbD/biopolymer transport protein TolR